MASLYSIALKKNQSIIYRSLLLPSSSSSSLLNNHLLSSLRNNINNININNNNIHYSISPLSPSIRYYSSSSPLSSSSSYSSSYSPLSSSSSSQNRSLERDANYYPHDALKQLSYYRSLINNDPYKIIARVEGGRYAYNTQIALLYAQAKRKVGEKQIKDNTYFLDSNKQNNSNLNNINTGNVKMDNNTNPNNTAINSDPNNLSNSNPPITYALNIMPSPTLKDRLLSFTLSVVGMVGAILIVTYILNLIASNTPGPMGSLSRDMGLAKDIRAVGQLSTVRFSDVKGCDEAKADLEEVVQFLKQPQKFNRLGGQMPKGVLLLGPPGTGKTLLAKAVAGEAGVPFFAASGSDFEEMFVGVGAKRIRELFAAAKKRSPAIIFIDEIDAVGSKRSSRDLSSTRMSLNQLLVEMDGFSETTGVVVIAATNFPQMLDPALTRPGRFDKHVTVPLPDVKGRVEILQHYGNKVQLSKEVDLKVVARGTPGASGADLYNLINSAAIRASALGRANVTMEDMEFARDKILMGAERKTHVMAEHERKNTAYHEGGHALVAIHTEGADPLHKATILPRGMALGLTHLLPEADVYSRSRKQLQAQLDVCMGGRLAEEMIHGHDGVTTGASNDLEVATKLARRMVMEFGMGESGSLPFRVAKSDEDFKVLSGEAKLEMDKEINRLLSESYQRAKSLLHDHRDELDRLANALLTYETLDREQIMAAVKGQPIPKSTYLHSDKPSKKTPEEKKSSPSSSSSSSSSSPSSSSSSPKKPKDVIVSTPTA